MTADQLLIKSLIANIEHEFSAIEAIFVQIQTLQEEIKDINPPHLSIFLWLWTRLGENETGFKAVRWTAQNLPKRIESISKFLKSINHLIWHSQFLL
jgi:hypothetical protein